MCVLQPAPRGPRPSALMAAAEPAAARPPQHVRLARLREQKSTACFCSLCGKQLKFGSFRVHACFKEAVRLHGRGLARQLVQRLAAPPGIVQGLITFHLLLLGDIMAAVCR